MTGAWRSQGARPRARALVILTAIVTIAAVFLPLTAAEAAYTYQWKGGSGVWTDAAKWTRVSGSGPLGTGYPNGVGDVARFVHLVGFPTVTIPDNVVITVGTIIFNSSRVVIQPFGSPTPKLVLDNGPGVSATLSASDGATTLPPVQLNGALSVIADDVSLIELQGVVEVGGRRSVTMSGGGTFHFGAHPNNLGHPFDYTGTTTIESGNLHLFGSGTFIRGDLVIGDGTGLPGLPGAQVFLSFDIVPGKNQIDDGQTVVVNAEGNFSTGAGSEAIGALVINGGYVNCRNVLEMENLTMTAGLLEAGLFESRLIVSGRVTATSSSAGPAVIRGFLAGGRLEGPGGTATFMVNDGPAPVDLELALPVGPGFQTAPVGLIKDGSGTLRFTGTFPNTYAGATLVRQGRLELALDHATAVPGDLHVGAGLGPAEVFLLRSQNIASHAAVSVGVDGILAGGGGVSQGMTSLRVDDGGRVVLGNASGSGLLSPSFLTMLGGRITLTTGSRVELGGALFATSTSTGPATIDGDGSLWLKVAKHQFTTPDGPQAIDLNILARIGGTGAGLIKNGPGVARFLGTNGYTGATVISQGTLFVSGSQPLSAITVAGGTLAGSGPVGTVTTVGGTSSMIAPGTTLGASGRLASRSVAFATGTKFAVEAGPTCSGCPPLPVALNGRAAGPDPGPDPGPMGDRSGDTLAVTGTVNLGNATLVVTAGHLPPEPEPLIIIENDGTDPVIGTFAGLPEGATVSSVDGVEFIVSYAGGDGNDVELSGGSSMSYFLTEGATGKLFDDDVLIANPNMKEAPVTLRFLQAGGRTVVEHRTVAAQARLTVHVDQIPGLEDTSASVQVTSDDRLPLVVERTMFWDAADSSGGHTATAVTRPERQWVFAEGAQGFFDTYLAIANTNAEPATATLTFLREDDEPVVKTVEIAPFSRARVYAGDYPEVVGRAFGLVVDATRPVFAERAMYFASLDNRTWAGGHVSTGSPAPSTSWLHAEGATGADVSTFILLSNPQETEAHVELRYLLDTGEVITRTRTLEARQRLTVSLATEDDTRLKNATVSTVVQADVPIVSERSMYWGKDATPFGEGHNSAGVAHAATRWGLAEGRTGGSRRFETFILLANPSPQEAQVTITYLRERGAPIVKTYAVPPTSRYSVDVKSVVPELKNAAFGARIEVTNGVPIAVERSLYWNANGVSWAGGTNALGTPLR